MADAADLKSAGVTPMWVRVPPALLDTPAKMKEEKTIEEVRTALRRATDAIGYDLLNETIVLGVSGGPDSLALLHIIRSLRRSEGIVVGHLDHGLRPDSAAEAAAVAVSAEPLRFHTRRVDVADLSKSRGWSIEEAGRHARYEFLADMARREGAAAILVGHNADDQAETILMHFLRGSGLSGLTGMREASPLIGNEDLWLIRPLLHTTREAIETYCIEHDLTPVHDASNTDPAFFRNRLRHELLPLLDTYNPRVSSRLRTMGEIVTAEEDLLYELTDSARQAISISENANTIEFSLAGWLDLPLALRRRTLRHAMTRLRPGLRDVGFKPLESARTIAERGETGATATLPGGLLMVIGYGKLILQGSDANPGIDSPQMLSREPIKLPIPGEAALTHGWKLTAEWVTDPDRQMIISNDDPWTAYLDIGQSVLIVRPRMPGDIMRPLGLGGQKKLKEIMIDRKIPATDRALWPIVTVGEQPAWLVGIHIDERVSVREESRHIVRLRCHRLDQTQVDAQSGCQYTIE